MSKVEKLDEKTYAEVMNEYNLAIYATSLSMTGRESEASGLRQNQIRAGSRNPVFYANEANYLSREERYAEALKIIEKAETLKCADDVTQIIKSKIMKMANK